MTGPGQITPRYRHYLLSPSHICSNKVSIYFNLMKYSNIISSTLAMLTNFSVLLGPFFTKEIEGSKERGESLDLKNPELLINK